MTKQADRTDGARPDVFVSYRHGDRQVASLLAHGLEQRSFRVWIDTADVRPGDHWQDRVAEGALNARACVIVVGQQGIDRVQADEVRLVLQRAYDDPDLPIIPVVLPHADAVPSWMATSRCAPRSTSHRAGPMMRCSTGWRVHCTAWTPMAKLGLTCRVRIRGSDRFGRWTPGSSSGVPGSSPCSWTSWTRRGSSPSSVQVASASRRWCTRVCSRCSVRPLVRPIHWSWSPTPIPSAPLRSPSQRPGRCWERRTQSDRTCCRPPSSLPRGCPRRRAPSATTSPSCCQAGPATIACSSSSTSWSRSSLAARIRNDVISSSPA